VDQLSKDGDPGFYDFPRSMINKGLDFSFSGLKTSVLYYTQEKSDSFIKEHIHDICASVSAAITDVLVTKLERAVKKRKTDFVMLAGGVSANSMLREKAQKLSEKLEIPLMMPAMQYCTDNAAMIAITGALKVREKITDGVKIKPFARVQS
jgi:N6-L-threonylcarbamoyladenine synthase